MEENSQPKKENASEDGNVIRPLRTYQDDISKLIQNQKISTAKIVLAEQQHNQQEEEVGEEIEKKNLSPVIKIILSVFLIILGFGAIFFTFQYNLIPKQIKKIIGSNQNNQIITEKSQININIDDKNSFEIRKEIANKILETDSFENINDEIISINLNKTETIEKNDAEEKVIVNATARNLFYILDIVEKDRLVRSFNDPFLLAIWTGIENVPFLILKTSDINLSFAEVHQWESAMYSDLRDVLNLKKEVPEFIEVLDDILASSSPSTAEGNVGPINTGTNSATSTASTTPAIKLIPNPEPKFDPKKFTDLVILNRDARAVLDESGSTILIYSFISDDTLVFTKDLNVLKKIINKISTQNLIR